MNNSIYMLLLIVITGIVTYLLRSFSFLAFGHGEKPPKIIVYIGKVISPAAIAMLVVYCYACFADDTGLEVDALGGAPGVYTARYAGDDKDFNKNMDKVLYELAVLEGEVRMAESLGLKMKPVTRRARFKSVVTLIVDGKIKIFEGTLEGVISREKSGNGGFGYDPIFIADEYPGLTLADISEEEKNAISHRGKALRAMAEWLNNNK